MDFLGVERNDIANNLKKCKINSYRNKHCWRFWPIELLN